MNLRFRNGQYYIWHTRKEHPPAGKLVAISTITGYKVTTKKDAEDFLKKYKEGRSKLKISSLFSLKAGHVKLSELSKMYTEGSRADLSASTLRMDRLSINAFKDVVSDKKVSRITEQDLIDFKNTCLARNVSPTSVKTYFRHIKAALNWAARNDMIKQVPSFPSVKAPKKLPQVIPREHLEAIMDYAKKNNPELWRIAWFSLHTGCRLSEIRNLKWTHLQFYAKKSNDVAGRAIITGKGDKQRIVPLLPAAVDALGSKQSKGPVFKQWISTTISREFKKSVRKGAEKFTGMEDEFEKYHFHSLRHTAATTMLEKGVKIETIQRILGHTDLSTTQIYATVLDSFMEEEMRKML